ncbi:hypothetical protein EV702DRAFT_498770 [Suillus placidus]|uniref:Uncharacterized protein n=1 Tax=Suillus placidus TaxID=48579 RepID=A0A9P7A3W4_9AGAM|nr:hypothetical protein EV702DRAFT_498770 [Suillus placidus]
MVANAGRILVKPMIDCASSIPMCTGRFCLRVAAQAMTKQGCGRRIIISASSVAGKNVFALNGIYCASKTAIRSRT